MGHVLQQELLVFHVRQLTPVHHGLLGEGLEREVLDLPQVGVFLLCSVGVVMDTPNAERAVVDARAKKSRAGYRI